MWPMVGSSILIAFIEMVILYHYFEFKLRYEVYSYVFLFSQYWCLEHKKSFKIVDW